ncbi:MAG: hypothetical protein A2140_06920 [Candidatus Muproteobacteria bacterium RBG_16_62_13]|uniref:Uncharacterized protein n=1 Tax=Candidatus Muproteobacteria bacterium RBG_16_62_13 TaxID=1817756 RepID=A0A1F6T564_9PROT|nr:MAG: hypothetical protein A2140_06920 [Candidatus Muproteobacteria bacterium RBG_16_62_13]
MTLAVAGLLGPADKAATAPKPDEPLKPGAIYSPTFTAPTMYQKFDLTPGLSVKLQVQIPVWQGFDFVAYAIASPFTEKWHIDIFKEGPGGIDLLTGVPLEKFEGLIQGVTDYQFSHSLNADWFKKHGPGKYGAKAYLSQTNSVYGEAAGMLTGVGFEIVGPPVKTSAQKPGNVVAKPSAAALGALAAAAKPNILVVGAKVEITKNCYGPAPALIAAVKLKNTGGALAAKKGKVFLKESGGAGLEGAADLPAFGAGQEQTVNVPATSLLHFSKLAGSHQLQVVLKAVIEGGQLSFNKPADPYMFTVVFPAGYCGGKALVPPKPSSSTPNEITNPAELNPQPEVPSKPKEKKKKSEREEKKLPAVQ